MIGLLAGLILLYLVFGRTRGLLGGLVGGLVGALVFAGMTGTASSGDLAALYSPDQLASTAVPVAIIAAVLALVAPSSIGFAAFGWAAGALLAAMAAPRAGQAPVRLSASSALRHCRGGAVLSEVVRRSLLALTLPAQGLASRG